MIVTVEQRLAAMQTHADTLHEHEDMGETFFRNILRVRRNWGVKPPRKQRCPECAADSMYKEITDAQKEMPLDLRVNLASRGFCHMTPACACRGECEETGVVEEVRELYKANRING